MTFDFGVLKKIKENFGIFFRYFDYSKVEDMDSDAYYTSVMYRDVKDLSTWLLKDPENPLPDDLKALVDSYYLDDEVYDNHQLLQFCDWILSIAKVPGLNTIWFITEKLPNGENDEKKIELFQKYLGYKSNEFVMVQLPRGMDRSEFAKDNAKDFTIFIDPCYETLKKFTYNHPKEKHFWFMGYDYNREFAKDSDFLEAVELLGSDFSLIPLGLIRDNNINDI